MINKKVSLYIHIPFCERKCNYCDFLSFQGTMERKEAYLSCLLREIQSWQQELKEYQVESIFIGGGTPSVLEASQITRLMEQIKELCILSPKCEITIECNPNSATLDKLRAYKQCGINRISFGVQSFEEKELKLLGRLHNKEQGIQAIEAAKEVGFTNINVDIMMALPEQNLKSYENTLNQVINLKVPHISAYSLILEPGTPFYEKEEIKKLLPTQEEERALYYFTRDRLQEAGYHQYEISNFAKEGFECEHNKVYWQIGEYLGIGLGASSYFKNKRFSQETDMTAYITKKEFKKAFLEASEVTKQATMEEFMFLGLRMNEGVSKEVFFHKFQVELEQVYKESLQKGQREKTIEVLGDKVRLTPLGQDVSNYVLSDFLL